MTNAASRAHSKAQLLWHIMAAGETTRPRLMEELGYSKAKVARLVSELLQDGLVAELGAAQAHGLNPGPGAVQAAGQDAGPAAGPGRKSMLLSAPDALGHVVGVSLGLRSCQAIVLGLHGREVRRLSVVQEEYPTGFESAAELTQWIVSFVGQLSTSLVEHGEPLWLAVAVPGAVRQGSELSALPAPLDVLQGVDVAALVASELGVPVEFGSDAEMALAGATRLGLVGAESSAVLFTMSTILTTATRTEAGLVTPRTAAFGDFSLLGGMFHVQHLSATGFAQLAREAGHSFSALSELWDADNPHLRGLWDGFSAAVTDAIVLTSVTADPETFVLTGRLAPLAELLLPEIEARVAARLQHPPRLLVVAKDSGWMVALGAAVTAVAEARWKVVADLLAEPQG